jgi:type I restriction-modification system DNA methylase subunit
MASQRKPTDPSNQDFIKHFNSIANHKLEPQPIDILGQLYMELELSSDHTGQYFSPSPISQLLAKISHGNNLSQLADHAFITLSEPACGAGGMVLAFAKEMLEHGHNPAEKLWAQCIDIDRTAALMCYIQLSLWNIPAQIIIGNTLSGEYRETLYTTAHYLFGWDRKLKLRQLLEFVRQEQCQDHQQPNSPVPEQETPTNKPNTETYRTALSNTASIMRGIQFDLFRGE